MGYSAYRPLGTAATRDIGTATGEVPVHDGANNLTVATFTAQSGAETTEYGEYGIAPYGTRITSFTIGGSAQTGTIVDVVLLGMKSNDAALKGGDVEIWGGSAQAGTSNGGDVSITGGSTTGGVTGLVELGGWADTQYSSEVKLLAPLTTNSTIDGVDLAAFAASPVTLTKRLSIKTPALDENITMFFTPIAITCTKCNSVTIGATSDATFNLYWNAETTRSNAGTAIHSGNIVADTAGTDTTLVAGDLTIDANSWVFIKTSAITNAPTELHVTLTYTED